MDDATIQSGDTREFWIRERCHITELINDPKTREFSLAEARVEPGVKTELHRLDVTEWYVIRRGEGRIEIGGQPWRDIVAGNFVAVPPGVSQRVENTGSEDLVFQCICLPRFTPDSYVSLEES